MTDRPPPPPYLYRDDLAGMLAPLIAGLDIDIDTLTRLSITAHGVSIEHGLAERDYRFIPLLDREAELSLEDTPL